MKYQITVQMSRASIERFGNPPLEEMIELGFILRSGQCGQYARLETEEPEQVCQYLWNRVKGWGGPIRGWKHDYINGETFDPRDLPEYW